MPMFGPHPQPSRAGKRGGITRMSVAARPMFSAPWNRRPVATSPTRHRIAPLSHSPASLANWRCNTGTRKPYIWSWITSTFTASNHSLTLSDQGWAVRFGTASRFTLPRSTEVGSTRRKSKSACSRGNASGDAGSQIWVPFDAKPGHGTVE